MDWPATAEELEGAQAELARAPSRLPPSPSVIGGVFVCFGRGLEGPGAAGDRGWVGAVSLCSGRVVEMVTVTGEAGAPYVPGLLALREGPLLEAAVRSLRQAPDVLIVNATGRDHPRRAGLALHLGAMVDVATVGVTNRPLAGSGAWPADLRKGSTSPVLIDGEVVARWVCTRSGAAPVVAHPAWGTHVDQAVELVLGAAHAARTPEPLRRARRLARTARASECSG